MAFSSRLMSILLAASVAFALPVAGAAAQDRAEMSKKIDKMERELRAVQRRVFGAGGVPAEAPSDVVGDSEQQKLLPDLVVRVGEMERQMSILTGRLEEMEFRQRQVEEAIELIQRSQATGAAVAPMTGAPANDTLPVTDTAMDTGAASAPAAPAADVQLPEGDADTQYKYAFAFVAKNDLSSATKALEQFVGQHSKEELGGNAKFWLGKVYARQNELPQAARNLLMLVEEHPGHPKLADGLVELADVLHRMDADADACSTLAEFNRIAGDASATLKKDAARISSAAKCS
ncbi:tetratricopeptide repeat protein [Gimibacter soli]|uniref:TolA-binding protein n=1 Tax=Gimibacter soli TaxID=3024400 RepID=A0AAE9XRT9_9PROT|nr:tetratricopeptide repeat protein [Gimibacter soli]WCL53785.1 hypothetical protein PH603_14690 [Gimibacter soli]